MSASRATSPDRAYYLSVYRSNKPTTGNWPRSPWPANWPGAAITRCARSRPRRCTHADLNLITAVGIDGRARPSRTSGSPRSAPATGMHASTRARRPYNTDATAAPTNGGHPIRIVVTDDIALVADLGNAGRPHGRRQPTKTDRHDQQSCARAENGLDSRPPTGNDGSVCRSRTGHGYRIRAP